MIHVETLHLSKGIHIYLSKFNEFTTCMTFLAGPSVVVMHTGRCINLLLLCLEALMLSSMMAKIRNACISIDHTAASMFAR